MILSLSEKRRAVFTSLAIYILVITVFLESKAGIFKMNSILSCGQIKRQSFGLEQLKAFFFIM